MKKIAIVIDSLAGGGAEKVMLSVAKGLIAFGNDVTFIIRKEKIDHFIPDNINIICLEKYAYKKRMKKKDFAKLLKDFVNKENYSLILSNLESTDKFVKLAQLENVYYVIHNTISKKLQNRYNKKNLIDKIKYLREIIKFKFLYSGENIITVSDGVKEDLLNSIYVKPKSIRTIYNPFDFESIREKAEVYNENIPKEKYIIYAAKFENRKNQKLLLEAYKKSNTELPLVLIGNVHTPSDIKYLEEIKQLIKDLDIENKIIFPGFQTNPYPWIKNEELFVMSSNSESLPLVLVEGLILGTKVVSTDCPTGPSELLIGDLKEYLSPVGDAEKLAENISKALKSYPKVEDDVLDRFKAEYSVGKYLDLCN